MSTFVELTDEEYQVLQPLAKAHYKRAYNKFHGIVKAVPDEAEDTGFVSKKMLREAIRDKCLDCTCDQRAEIKMCPVTNCPLWKHRPYQGIKITEADQESVDIDDEAA
jgi:hypothetical protein